MDLEEPFADGLDELVDRYGDDAGQTDRDDPVYLDGVATSSGEEGCERYDILLDHDDDRAVLVEPGEELGGDYQRLGDPPSGEDGYEVSQGAVPDHPSSLARAGASLTAGSITAAFVAAEAGLEATYNGLCGLVRLLD